MTIFNFLCCSHLETCRSDYILCIFAYDSKIDLFPSLFQVRFWKLYFCIEFAARQIVRGSCAGWKPTQEPPIQ